ncbi:hypothetical protein [Subdoligranulum variabile]|uniref:hypothetical protein n=1 Tax=Subdoligranulum variabile TaxID=214851 RepID=UPI0026EF87D4|nr:hypothetical protein [Subdoligranulum variabile]
MKKSFARGAAFALTAVLLAALGGCTASAPTEPIQKESEVTTPAETPAPATEETAASAAAETQASLPDPEGAAVFSYAQCEEAAQRAEQYWYDDMITGPAAYRYAVAESVATSVVPYEDCILNEQLLMLVSYGEEGERALDRIYAGIDLLVEVHFYVEYEPEINYLGPQYGDGLTAVYILVPVDTSQPCEVISGWYSDQNGERMLRPDQGVVVEGLTVYQSRMLEHQCRALAQAGLREFTSSADWTEEELYRYLYFRGQDFGYTEEEWQNNRWVISTGNRLLTIDFTAEDDWYDNQRFLSTKWPGFSAENIEKYSAGLDSGAVPGYRGEDTDWQFQWDGVTLVARMNGESGQALQEYRFQLYEGVAPWNGRAYCVGGQPIA